MRLVADVRISVKVRGGKCHRLELIKQPMAKRYWLRFDGRNSRKMPESTKTEVLRNLGKLF